MMSNGWSQCPPLPIFGMLIKVQSVGSLQWQISMVEGVSVGGSGVDVRVSVDVGVNVGVSVSVLVSVNVGVFVDVLVCVMVGVPVDVLV